jgi:hypothetical protein
MTQTTPATPGLTTAPVYRPSAELQRDPTATAVAQLPRRTVLGVPVDDSTGGARGPAFQRAPTPPPFQTATTTASPPRPEPTTPPISPPPNASYYPPPPEYEYGKTR